jgi:tRNA(Ile)-lysidine synthase
MFERVNKALIAFSAGPDSVCMLDVLHSIFVGQIEFELVYVNHGLRPGAFLKREERMTQEYAARYSLHHKILRVTVQKKKEGIEASARKARYQALNRYFKRTGAQRIVLGHNLDDFVETFLLNVVRGSGMRGLRSIAAVRLPFVRPMISLKKNDILKYLKARKLAYSLDETNQSLDYRRNVMRLKVLPILEQINPEIHEAIQREVSILKQDDEYLWKQTEKAYRKAVRYTKDCVLLDTNMIMRYNFSILNRLVMKAIQELNGNLDGFESKHYYSIISLTDKECSKRISLPKGIYAQREHGNIALVKKKPRKRLAVQIDLDAGVVSAGRYRLSLSVKKKYVLRNSCGNREVFDMSALSLPLYIRSCRAGDTLETKIGKKKVKKIFSESRIAPRERGEIPVLCDPRGILWIVGVARAFRGFVSKKTREYMVVDFERFD